MKDRIEHNGRTDAEPFGDDGRLFNDDVSDEALEAAAGTSKDTVMTLPGGLSVNVMCCGAD